MAITVASIQARLVRRYPSFNDSAVQLEYINEAHRDICRQLPLITAIEDLSVTAETQDYAYNADDIRVVQVEWVTGATSGERRALEATDIDYLRQEQPQYLRQGSGTPSRYYLDRMTTEHNGIGFLPKPSQTTSGGYPVARLHVTRVETLVGADSLPEGVLSADPWVYGAFIRWCADREKYAKDIPNHQAMYDAAVALERKTYDERHARYPRRVAPTGINMGGVK